MNRDAVDDVGRILVPVDGSDSAASALDHAITLASEVDAEIHLLAVVDPYDLSSVTERQEVESELGDHLERAAARVREAGVPVSTATVEGFPHEEILDAVDDEAIDLIAMGTHGRTGLDRYVLGSVAEKVVRLSPVSVLTVRDEATSDRPYRDIVIPTDGSEAATPAERLGLNIARHFGATAHAISVDPKRRFRSRDTDAAYENAAREAVERIREGGDGGVDIETAVESGVPHREILKYCETVGADLVMLGTHGRTGVERFVLGSVAEKIVRLSDTPVLTVPASGADRESGRE